MAITASKKAHVAPESAERAAAKRARLERPAAPRGVEISRGAEAVVTRIGYLGRAAVRKERLAKRYRHPQLDAKLTARRLAQEARMLLRLRKAGVRVPALYRVDAADSVLVMEWVRGRPLKEWLRDAEARRGEAVMREAGRAVASMHACGVVHGDLTTGNVMVVEGATGEGGAVGEGADNVCMIDFGLSSANATEEDMAVDLYVLERAVIAAHSEVAHPLNDAFLEAYAAELGRPAVMKRLAEVRSRGRKRDMTG